MNGNVSEILRAWAAKVVAVLVALRELLGFPPLREAAPPLPPLRSARPLVNPDKRRAMARLNFVLTFLVAVAVSVPTAWFLLSPLLRFVPRRWTAVGTVDSFVEGHTVKVSFRHATGLEWSGGAGESAAWLRREKGDQFVAFAVFCSHLGCPVRWESSAQLFMCPCHGGVYYSDGMVAAGPPPRPLARYPVRVRDGEVEIGTMRIPIAGVS